MCVCVCKASESLQKGQRKRTQDFDKGTDASGKPTIEDAVLIYIERQIGEPANKERDRDLFISPKVNYPTVQLDGKMYIAFRTGTFFRSSCASQS